MNLTHYWNLEKYENKLSWACTEIRRLIVQTTTWKPNAKKPRQRWLDRINENLKILRITNAEGTAKDRKKWRQYFMAVMCFLGRCIAEEEES